MLPRITPIILSLLFLVGAARGSDLRLTGQLVCGGPQHTAGFSNPCPAGSEAGFRSDDGNVFFFSEDDPRKAIFEDSRVSAEKLRITARVGENGRLLLLLVHTLKEGRLFLPHYFCSVCNITAYAPGPCWCCQAEFEFREREVEDPGTGKPMP